MKWLSVPVGKDINRKIKEVKLPEGKWRENHLNAISSAYSKCPYYNLVDYQLQEIFRFEDQYLSKLNQYIITTLTSKFVNSNVKFLNDLDVIDEKSFSDKNDRVLTILKELGATRYLSGPSAKSYLKDSQFIDEGIEIVYADYSNYKKYQQSGDSFHDEVTFLDLISWQGPLAENFLKKSDLFS